MPPQVSELAVTLLLINRGCYDDVKVDRALAFEAAFLSHLKTSHADLLARIDEKGELAADDEATIFKAVDSFKASSAF